MAATDNLTSMHKHEEELRASSLAAIEADAALSDHWNLVAEAMNAVYAFTHDHPHRSENASAILSILRWIWGRWPVPTFVTRCTNRWKAARQWVQACCAAVGQ